MATQPRQQHQHQQRQQEDAFRILPASLAPWGTPPDAACCQARLQAYLEWDGTCGKRARAAAQLPPQLYLVLQQLLSQFAYCCPDSDELVVRSTAVVPFKESLLRFTHERIQREVGIPRDSSSSREDKERAWARRNDIVGLLLLNAALRQVSRAGAGSGSVSLRQQALLEAVMWTVFEQTRHMLQYTFRIPSKSSGAASHSRTSMLYCQAAQELGLHTRPYLYHVSKKQRQPVLVVSRKRLPNWRWVLGVFGKGVDGFVFYP